MMGVFLRTGSTEFSKILLGKNPEGEGGVLLGILRGGGGGCAAKFYQS